MATDFHQQREELSRRCVQIEVVVVGCGGGSLAQEEDTVPRRSYRETPAALTPRRCSHTPRPHPGGAEAKPVLAEYTGQASPAFARDFIPSFRVEITKKD